MFWPRIFDRGSESPVTQTREIPNTILTFADPSVSNILGWIFIKAFFAVMTESSRRVVSAVNTDPPTVTSRQFKKLYVEHACFCMQVAVAS